MMNKLDIFKTLNLLYVEDDSTSANIFKEIFHDYFQNVYHASNGLEALDIYMKNQINIIITDVKMPKMDGLEFIKEIREGNENIPIFVISSYSEKEQLLKAIKLNLSDYIIKPLSVEKIKEALHSCLNKFENDIIFYIQNTQKFTYSSNTRILSSGEMKVRLQNKEALLLELFLKHKTQIVTKDMIVEELYGIEPYSEGTIKNMISKLRKKLGNDAIKTIKFSGYTLL